MLATIPVLQIGALQVPRTAQNTYTAAEIHYGDQTEDEVRRGGHLFHVLTLYPLDGPSITMTLPSLAKNFSPVAFSSDGRAIYIFTPAGAVALLRSIRRPDRSGSCGLERCLFPWHWSDTGQAVSGRTTDSCLGSGQDGSDRR